MAIWDFRPKGDLWTGVAVGAGLLAAPVVLPLAWSATRPVLKAILKGGFMLYATGRQMLGEATEEPVKERVTAEKEGPRVTAAKMRTATEKKELISNAGPEEERAEVGRAKPRQPEKKQSKKTKKEK